MAKSQPRTDWIMAEGGRNRNAAMLSAQLLTMSYGPTFELFIGHHIAYKAKHEDTTTLSEIPSIDTLLFNHPIMQDVFGERYLDVVVQLARTPTEKRERALEQMLHDYASGSLPEKLCKYSMVQNGGLDLGGAILI